MERVQTEGEPNPSSSALNSSKDIASDIERISNDSNTKTGGGIQCEPDRKSVSIPEYTTSVQSSDLTMNHETIARSPIEEVLNQSISIIADLDGTASPTDNPSGTIMNGDDANCSTPSTSSSYTEGESMHERRISFVQGKELESMDLSELLSLCKMYRNRVADCANPQDVVSLQLINEVLARKIDASASSQRRRSNVESTPLEQTREQNKGDSEKDNTSEKLSLAEKEEKRLLGAIERGIEESVRNAIHPDIDYHSERVRIDIGKVTMVSNGDEGNLVLLPTEPVSPLSLPPLMIQKRDGNGSKCVDSKRFRNDC